MQLIGTAAVGGIGIGRVLLISGFKEPQLQPVKDSNVELNRFREAAEGARRELQKAAEETRSLDAAAAEMIEAQLAMAEDPEFLASIEEAILEGCNFEYAVWATANKYADILRSASDQLFKERAADVLSLAQRIIAGPESGLFINDFARGGEGIIVVAQDLSPLEMTRLLGLNVSGIVTERGGLTSHFVILAKSYGIPTVVGVEGVLDAVVRDVVVIVDGNEGVVFVDPSRDLLTAYESRKNQQIRSMERLVELAQGPALTLDGTRILVEANIGRPEEASEAIRLGADGIGLFRTEFAFINRIAPPSEDEQFEYYASVVEAMRSKPVVIRTLDVGGDKHLPYLRVAEESNPFLGLRGIRLCKKYPEILKVQLRAILRASAYGEVGVMFPMVTDLREIFWAKTVLKEAMDELESEGIPFDRSLRVGVMIEVPSAAILAEELAPHVDFFSIGTNDLTQYTLAVDRGSESVRDYYDHLHPAVLRLVRLVIDAANKHGKVVAVCGELAGDLRATKFLAESGLRVFSVSPSAVPVVKDAIRRLELPSETKGV
ncbi:phosphoenolpyruvate--protein phosphotransferase [Coprothermobacteraceae bacterium]|nr:phosphoenolpyruvate--protein phosphotransferase [Coprothermobacteraceae bacterium]